MLYALEALGHIPGIDDSMNTAAEIRQSFLDFFASKQHRVVPSASLLPTAPNLLFTNAGMNPFVPYFLGQQKPPYDPPRATNTQKCIRAGGKHNDLEDVGYDTYHHTFFEMLGNWSFGDYFKKEAITWAWELLVERWGFPPERLYATVYEPGQGEPADFDAEAAQNWTEIFRSADLDPAVHVMRCGAKDNFWMMGDTGPCGPCSEIHIDLTPEGETKGKLVNADDPRCIEIWNLVFIQFQAEPDGSFLPLPTRHVDTGMGFERVASVIQGTDHFRHFHRAISNYDTDLFTAIFNKIRDLSGKKYGGRVPATRGATSPEEEVDIAFRVIADHARTLCFSIADGILPGNTDRHYVLRRILRRAVRYGRVIGIEKPFLAELLLPLIATMGGAFPELGEQRDNIAEVLQREEESFRRTLDRGLKLFEGIAEEIAPKKGAEFPAEAAFELYDTYGFPLDLTALMARERGFHLDESAVEKHLEAQRERARQAQRKEIIALEELESTHESEFIGYETDCEEGTVLAYLDRDDHPIVLVDRTPFYAEMGGQVSDTGTLTTPEKETFPIVDTRQVGASIYLQLGEKPSAPLSGKVVMALDVERRRAIEAHHTATHLLHWAIHEGISHQISQKGSYVGPDRLRFDINSKPLTDTQILELEEEVNRRILANAPVAWREVPYAEVSDRPDIIQFFGDKYGDRVRVVQIGGQPGALDGYSMELCGGTHVRATGQIGLFKIQSESAIAAGIRRIEAVCALPAHQYLREVIHELEREKSTLAQQLKDAEKSLAKQQQAALQGSADQWIREHLPRAEANSQGIPVLLGSLENESPQLLGEILNGLNKRKFPGIAFLALSESSKVHLAAFSAPEIAKAHPAGQLIKDLAPIVGGRGGGKPEMARGAGSEPEKVKAMLEKARKKLFY